MLGTTATVWRGVQTYSLSRAATPIATRGGHACGYSRRLGRGEAVLLGTWLAADCVPGRAGAILEQQQLASGSSNEAVIAAGKALACKRLGAAATGLVSGPLPGGQPQELIVYDYGNERRGGDVISGGALAYWDGQNVVGLVEVDTTETGPAATQIPYHPIEPAHVAAAQALAALTPHVAVSDERVQARLLTAPSPGAATVMAANRWDSDANVVIKLSLDGRRLRLPRTGSLALPAGASVLLPIGYELGHGVTVVNATVQLTGATLSAHGVTLDLWTPAGGEIAVALTSSGASGTLDGKPLGLGRHGPLTVEAAIPPGDHVLALSWTGPRRARRRRRR